eukprot:TRINITY_DN15455_c0_g1_i1.p2 TRINITY_DN15455_c0_g1~~TRINITY_DN15455_c0_g1_i1.p2  ORF type:complete len:104 (-),score=3.45 TRINITY_DN15455_c0_g1_i1:310-621(-)
MKVEMAGASAMTGTVHDGNVLCFLQGQVQLSISSWVMYRWVGSIVNDKLAKTIKIMTRVQSSKYSFTASNTFFKFITSISSNNYFSNLLQKFFLYPFPYFYQK